jgi:hypothetical protein
MCGKKIRTMPLLEFVLALSVLLLDLLLPTVLKIDQTGLVFMVFFYKTGRFLIKTETGTVAKRFSISFFGLLTGFYRF